MMKTPKIVATYTRRSSVSDTKQSKSHARQSNEIESFCQGGGYVVMEEFSDTQSAFHGPLDGRPGFMSLLRWLDGDGSRIVVMTEVSRLARRVDVWSQIRPRLHQFRFVELGDTQPTTLMVSIFLALAEEESRKLGERVKSAYRLKETTYGKGNFKWGNPLIKNHSDRGRETSHQKMRDWWEPILMMDAYLYKSKGLDQKARAARLNQLGKTTRPTKKNRMLGSPITSRTLWRAHKQCKTGGVKELSKEL